MEIGKERIYNNEFEERVVLWDVIKLSFKSKFIVRFISTNSRHRQGIRIAIDVGKGMLEINNIKSKEFALWEDTAPKEIVCTFESDSGLLSVYNIWEDCTGEDSQADSSGMLIESIDNKYLYRCNDFGFETNFDKLIFEIEKI